ncbi:MAG: porin [bacterium]
MKKSLITFLATIMIAGLVNIASAVPIEDLKVDISGLGQWGYHVSQITGDDDEFDTNRLRIKISAQPAENVKFYAALEGTNNTSAMAAGNNVPANCLICDGAADSRLVDMNVTLTYLEWVTVIIGQLPSPVSYELNTDEYDLETINYSQIVGIANRDRGIGLIIPLHPELSLITWVLNGSGAISGATNNPDDRYAYGAMLEYQPYQEFKVKLFGHFTDTDTDVVIASNAANAVDVDAWGGGLDYKWYGFRVMGEYVHARLKMSNAAGAQTGTAKTEEWYAHGSYEIPKTDLQIVARYDRYDPDTTSGAAGANDETQITTIGMNWDFEQDCRLQLMHQFMKREYIPAGPGSDRNADQTDVQLSVRF